MKTTLQTILEELKLANLTTVTQGFKFENLIKNYFLSERLYAQDGIQEVWLWSEFPFKEQLGSHDLGIDLVIKTYAGSYWAVQCKFYDIDSTISKIEVDSFIATINRSFSDNSGANKIFERAFFISTASLGVNANETLHNQTIPITLLLLSDLEDSSVDWLKISQGKMGLEALKQAKKAQPHQEEAISKTLTYFNDYDKGKLIMACGTGKTFTSLTIAQQFTNNRGLILFLVPSIALLNQSLRAWAADAKENIEAICVCSDSKASQTKKNSEDESDGDILELARPASTNVDTLVNQLIQPRLAKGMRVVFSTYQSLEIVSKAQAKLANTVIFDLVICDEAHRTSGINSVNGEDWSFFTKIHDEKFIKAQKLLFMTATPKIYADDAKQKASDNDAVLSSMDDENIYGKEIYRLGFAEAVERDLLCDYEIIILTVSTNSITPDLQKRINDPNDMLDEKTTLHLLGAINALDKNFTGDDGRIKNFDPSPMRKAVAYCATIKDSQKFTKEFSEIRKHKDGNVLHCQHIDGTMNSSERGDKMKFLDHNKTDELHILTNVRCLSEGIDVPSLDAIIFLSAKNSQVEVVQSVGRVMRKAEGKKRGYIIIPVIVPIDIDPIKALDDNKNYAVVWSVLNALKAHDERFNAMINQIQFEKGKPPTKPIIGRIDPTPPVLTQANLKFPYEEYKNAILGRLVLKLGERDYWQKWAKEVGDIANRQIEKINDLIASDSNCQTLFDTFLKELQASINPLISKAQAIEMLGQQIITRPVFNALFSNYVFVKNNPISQSMQPILQLLDDNAVEKDLEILQRFYASVQRKLEGIDSDQGKQELVVDLYDNFFKLAMPKTVEKLGIVYTPLEVVDFIVKSCDDVLYKEFGRRLTDENIKILDPFTGTGTFITRLLQLGMIKEKDLDRKYSNEIFASDIVLLAYYIANVNIESAYHYLKGLKMSGSDYKNFRGMVLTDTFYTYERPLEKDEKAENFFINNQLEQNHDRVRKLAKTKLTVIMGNPPYSKGQKDANDNAQNDYYEKLAKRIQETYVAKSDATNNNSLHDSYIKAFRWASDKLEQETGGIIGFVSNSSYLDGNSTAGFRKCLEQEFSTIYVLNLRGNQRTSGELSRKEGGKIFGSGSRTPIAITILVKRPNCSKTKADIYYKDIGDYLKREEKLTILKGMQGVLDTNMEWQQLQPNETGDWISMRSDEFAKLVPLIDKNNANNPNTVFNFSTLGLQSSRDSWVANYSKVELTKNMQKTIEIYNSQLGKAENELEMDSTKISWSRGLRKQLLLNRSSVFNINSITTSNYRPFCKQYYYCDKLWNEYQFQQLRIFGKEDNLSISIPTLGDQKDFSCLMSNIFTDMNLLTGSYSLPLFYYRPSSLPSMPAEKVSAINPSFITTLRKQYGDVKITDKMVFYYVYAQLHHPAYRIKFAADLKKLSPRIPIVSTFNDFTIYYEAGAKLANLHVYYESAKIDDLPITITKPNYTVQKMRFAKARDANGKSIDDKSTIIYNSAITISSIPIEAYSYIVNGKSAIEWVMERYAITTDKKSGLTNDPNLYCAEIGDEKYIFNLLLQVITVSMETVKIVNELPKWEE